MNYELYFPRGIASGAAFCNRISERNQLKQNIKTGQHTLLTSSRRYGKTSLILYVVKKMGIPFGETDLFVAVDAKKIEHGILTGVKQVITSIGTPMEQVLNILRNYFKDKNAHWTIGTQGVNVALEPSVNSDPANNILEALQALENLLQKKKKRAVLFLDEVQEIGEIVADKSIEGAIRHVAQKTKYLSLIFSGSNRHLLGQMFYDKSRPLYKLCDRIVLSRIERNEYEKHINKFAVKRWKMLLTNDVFDKIFELTELHPYYVNNLCLHLWGNDGIKIPKSENVIDCWNKIIQAERSETLRELSTLSIGQRKILGVIAGGQTTGLTSKNILQEIDLTGASVFEAIKVLMQKDYVEQMENGGYRIIDPLIKHTLLFYGYRL